MISETIGLAFEEICKDSSNVDRCRDARDSYYTQCVGAAGFTLLLWDHIITFPDEVQYIWRGNKGPLVYLFFLNRYLIPLSFTVNIYAYFSHSWTRESCNHFVRYEGSMTMIGISIVALMMFLRIRALYYGRRLVQGLVLLIFAVYVCVNAWLLTHGTAVPHGQGSDMPWSSVRSCSMIFDDSVSTFWASGSAWLPLLYDTTVVGLTLFSTLKPVWRKDPTKIRRVLLEEGLLYYSVICSVTLTLTIMIASAPPSVQLIAAQLELLLTVTMMSRITIHLRRFARSRSLGCSISMPTPLPRDQIPRERIPWRAVTHPSRARAIMPIAGHGRVQHVQRAADDTFLSMMTTTQGWSTCAVASGLSQVSHGRGLSEGEIHVDVVERVVVEEGGVVDLEEEFYGAEWQGKRSAGGAERIEMRIQKKLRDEEEGGGMS